MDTNSSTIIIEIDSLREAIDLIEQHATSLRECASLPPDYSINKILDRETVDCINHHHAVAERLRVLKKSVICALLESDIRFIGIKTPADDC